MKAAFRSCIEFSIHHLLIVVPTFYCATSFQNWRILKVVINQHAKTNRPEAIAKPRDASVPKSSMGPCATRFSRTHTTEQALIVCASSVKQLRVQIPCQARSLDAQTALQFDAQAEPSSPDEPWFESLRSALSRYKEDSESMS